MGEIVGARFVEHVGLEIGRGDRDGRARRGGLWLDLHLGGSRRERSRDRRSSARRGLGLLGGAPEFAAHGGVARGETQRQREVQLRRVGVVAFHLERGGGAQIVHRHPRVDRRSVLEGVAHPRIRERSCRTIAQLGEPASLDRARAGVLHRVDAHRSRTRDRLRQIAEPVADHPRQHQRGVVTYGSPPRRERERTAQHLRRARRVSQREQALAQADQGFLVRRSIAERAFEQQRRARCVTLRGEPTAGLEQRRLLFVNPTRRGLEMLGFGERGLRVTFGERRRELPPADRRVRRRARAGLSQQRTFRARVVGGLGGGRQTECRQRGVAFPRGCCLERHARAVAIAERSQEHAAERARIDRRHRRHQRRERRLGAFSGRSVEIGEPRRDLAIMGRALQRSQVEVARPRMVARDQRVVGLLAQLRQLDRERSGVVDVSGRAAQLGRRAKSFHGAGERSPADFRGVRRPRARSRHHLAQQRRGGVVDPNDATPPTAPPAERRLGHPQRRRVRWLGEPHRARRVHHQPHIAAERSPRNLERQRRLARLHADEHPRAAGQQGHERRFTPQ